MNKANQKSTPENKTIELSYDFEKVCILSPQYNYIETAFNKLFYGESHKLYSGYLNCSLYILNQLFVGNEQEKGENDITTIKPLKVQNKILISPYTLKSCFKSTLSAAIHSKMKQINKRDFVYENDVTKNAQKNTKYAVGIYNEITNDISEPDNSNSKRHYIEKITDFDTDTVFIFDNLQNFDKNKPKDYYMKDNHYSFNSENHEHCGAADFEAFDNASTKYKYPYKDIKENKCLFIKKECIVESQEYEIDSEVLNKHKKTFKSLKEHYLLDNASSITTDDNIKKVKDAIECGKKISDGDLVFFEYFIDTNNDTKNNKVLSFGSTSCYPWIYEKELSAKDFPEDIAAENELSIIDDMFGYSNDHNEKIYSKSGKIHINFATPTREFELNDYTLDRPGTPKPGTCKSYLIQNNSDQIITFGKSQDNLQNIRLKGRKFYKKKIKAKLQNKEKKDYSVVLKDVIEGAKDEKADFKFKVNFNSLNEIELGLLIASIELDTKDIHQLLNYNSTGQKPLCHQIGYGKNYGIGAIKCIVDESNILSGNDFNKHDIEEFRKTINKSKNLISKRKTFEIDYTSES